MVTGSHLDFPQFFWEFFDRGLALVPSAWAGTGSGRPDFQLVRPSYMQAGLESKLNLWVSGEGGEIRWFGTWRKNIEAITNTWLLVIVEILKEHDLVEHQKIHDSEFRVGWINLDRQATTEWNKRTHQKHRNSCDLDFGDLELWSIKVMVGPVPNFLTGKKTKNGCFQGLVAWNINSYIFVASLLIYVESNWDVSWSFCSEVSLQNCSLRFIGVWLPIDLNSTWIGKTGGLNFPYHSKKNCKDQNKHSWQKEAMLIDSWSSSISTC